MQKVWFFMLQKITINILIFVFCLLETSPDFTSVTTTEEKHTETTITDMVHPDIISSSGTTSGTTYLTSTTVSMGSSPGSTYGFSSSSLGTSTTNAATSGFSTLGTTYTIPQTFDTTIPYRETLPPETPSTTVEQIEHEHENIHGHVDLHEPDHENGEINMVDRQQPDYGSEEIDRPPPPLEPETEPPPLIRPSPPIQQFPPTPRSKHKHRPITPEAEERTAMIIGIVAGALIAVILVILLVLWIKSHGDRNYKTEHDIKYGLGPNAALLGNSGTNSSQRDHHAAAAGGQHQSSSGNGYQGNQHNQYNNQHQNGGSSNMQLNGSLRQNGSDRDRNGSMSAGLVQPKPKRNSKDIKEWYV